MPEIHFTLVQIKITLFNYESESSLSNIVKSFDIIVGKKSYQKENSLKVIINLIVLKGKFRQYLLKFY